MANLSIFEKKWLNLVFEGKNQEYGAYKLRKDSTKTTIIAFFSGIAFIFFISGAAIMLSSFSKNPIPSTTEPVLDSIIRVHHVIEPKKDKEKFLEKKSKTKKQAETPDNKNYVVAPQNEALEEVKPNSEQTNNNTTNETDSDGLTGTIGSISGQNVVPEVLPTTTTTIAKTFELDKQPVFPGGIKKFYDYIGSTFEKQNINEDSGQSIKVLVTFVIEKNGTMTDIEVTRKTSPDVDKEAIRVLKSLKTKWSPGFKNGEPVRTQFTLPITVML